MKWYSIIYMERVGMSNHYLPKLKHVRTNDIHRYLKNTDLDVQFVFEGKLKSL